MPTFYPGATGGQGLKVGEPNYDVYQTDSTHYYGVKLADNSSIGPYSDFTPLINAIQAILTTGGHVFVRDGTYNITTELDITVPNFIIEGEKNAILFLNFNATNYMIEIKASNDTLMFLIIDGNRTVYTNNDGIGLMIGSINGQVLFCIIRNWSAYSCDCWEATSPVYAFNRSYTCQYGFSFSGNPPTNYTMNGLIIGNYIYDCYNVCIKVRASFGCIVTANRCDVADITVGTNITYGIRQYIEDAADVDVEIIGNWIEDSTGVGTGAGIMTGWHTGDTYSRGNSVLNNTIENCYYGIVCKQSNTLIKGNTITGRASGHSGIRLGTGTAALKFIDVFDNRVYATGIVGDAISNCRIERNFVTGGLQSTPSGSGIAFWAGGAEWVCDSNIIKDNQVDTVTGYGIDVYWTTGYLVSTNNQIIDNVLTNCTSGPIRDLGTTTTYRGFGLDNTISGQSGAQANCLTLAPTIAEATYLLNVWAKVVTYSASGAITLVYKDHAGTTQTDTLGLVKHDGTLVQAMVATGRYSCTKVFRAASGVSIVVALTGSAGNTTDINCSLVLI